MSENYHVAFPVGTAANAAEVESRFASLDAGIGDAMSFGVNNNAELVAARSPYPSLDARLDALVMAGGNVATKANGVSAAGQKVLTVDATDGFIVGAYVTYLLNGATLEGNTISSIQAGVSLTLGTNIGATPAGGVLDDTYISMISISEHLAAQAIPHTGTLMLPQTVEYVGGNVRYVDAFAPNGTDDTVAIQAAIDSMSARGKLVFGAGKTYYISDTLDLTDLLKVTIDGAQASIKTKAGVDFSGKAMLDCAGAEYVSIRDLFVESSLTGADSPAAGIVLGRTANQAGGFNHFEQCTVTGYFDVACLYNVGEEVDLFASCRFINYQAKGGAGVPACCLYDSSDDTYNLVTVDQASNVRKSYLNCTFWAYGAVSPCIQFQGTCQENMFRDCYFYITAGGIVIETLGTAQQYKLNLENCRVEGSAATGYGASRLLRISNSNGGISGLKIDNLTWSFTDSVALIEVAQSLSNAYLDLRGQVIAPVILVKAAKTFSNSMVFYDYPACISVENTATAIGLVVIGYDSATGAANPFTGAGGYEGLAANYNVVFNAAHYAQLPAIRTFNRIPITNDDATPSVKGYSILDITNANATSITTFDDGVEGQELNVFFGNGNTTLVHGNTLKLAGSINKQFATGDSISLYYNPYQGAWVEKSRMIA